ncbi:MAG: protein translocase subunit SecF [Candidatus Pacebacteria bacterium]|nr:protein translocase subunit SecF [Candidatus Paceibacterota bacterium]
MIIVTYRKVFYVITGILAALSVAALLVYGLNLSTEFTGGTFVQVQYENERPAREELIQALTSVGLHDVSVRTAGEKGYDIRADVLSDDMRAVLPEVVQLNQTYPGVIERMSEVGPTIGKELRTKAVYAISLVLVAIMLFVAFVFRRVSRPVSSWVYGGIALVALAHDVLIPLGFYALLGHYFGAQVDTLFVTAILTVLGFSVHDTIVVFDRVRENLKLNHEHNRHESFELLVGRSLQQTLVRSVNTSVTVLLTLLALFFVGPESTQDFALTLLVGIIAGTYSSIAIASPLLVTAEKYLVKRG